MLRKFWIPCAFVLAIAFGNIYILISSQSKIIKYADQPPFRLDDFTKSYKISPESRLSHLLDHDPTTNWLKLSEGLEDKDFEMELTLTHRWDGKEFIPKLPLSIKITNCSNSNLALSVLLREAISVDKELRLPNDTVELSQEYSTRENEKITISLDPIRRKLKPSQDYPQGISIVTLRGKFLNPEGCIQAVELIAN